MPIAELVVYYKAGWNNELIDKYVDCMTDWLAVL